MKEKEYLKFLVVKTSPLEKLIHRKIVHNLIKKCISQFPMYFIFSHTTIDTELKQILENFSNVIP